MAFELWKSPVGSEFCDAAEQDLDQIRIEQIAPPGPCEQRPRRRTMKHSFGHHVILKLYEKSAGEAEDAMIPGFDKIIIPFSRSIVEIQASDPATIQLAAGSALFLSNEDRDTRGVQLWDCDCLVLNVRVSDRSDAEGVLEDSCAHWLATESRLVMTSSQLSEVANTARRLLLLGYTDSTDTTDALGDVAISVIMASLSLKRHDTQPLADEDVKKIADHIDENLDWCLTLGELAEICDLSVRQFTRAFKTKTGEAPYQYILNRRLTLAQRLLASTEHSVSDISYAVGFSSPPHMTDMFRALLGMTPAKYRENAVSR